MPCNSDYMKATGLEIALSRVYQLLDEIDGEPIDKAGWSGYDYRAYGHADKKHTDKKVSELCAKLKRLDVKKYSLEMQIWWRDHQAADRERIAREKMEKKRQKEKSQALAKLTSAERKLLGF